MKIFNFLASVTFAIGLLAASALIVIAGTWIESLSGSHRFAASFAYSNPVFLLLLSLYFVNILFSALKRWPFTSRQVPFLITHLGLLMIILGVMLKMEFGLQGEMSLMEGSSSDTVIIPDTYRLHIQTPNGLTQQPLKGNIVHYSPHSEERFETWIKGSFAYLDGIKPFPVYPYKGEIPVSTRMKIPNDHAPHWDLYAFTADDPFEVAKKVYLEGLTLRLTDRQTKKIVHEGAVENINDLQIQSHGFTIPVSGEKALLNFPCQTTAADLHTTPKLLFVKDKQNTHLFAFDAYGQFFSESFPHDKIEKYIAYDKGYSGYAVQTKIPFPVSREMREKKIFSSLSARELKGAAWGAYLLKEKRLKEWPLASLLTGLQDQEEALLRQVFLVAEDLPEPPEEATPEEKMMAYLKAYSLYPTFDERIVFECPLTVRHVPAEPHKKLEDNRPMIVLKGGQTLAYDPHAVNLPWPKDGALLSFRPQMVKIPYKIRLRDARQINYPGMDQAFSYESDIWIGSKEKTLSMNEVYETGDGTRFYLSSIFPKEEIAVQRVKLVVNRDPFKWFTTYPGGIFVALGIVLLFFRKNNAKVAK